MHYIWHLLFLIFLPKSNQIYSVSIVYTMKLQRIFFAEGSTEKENNISSTSLTALPLLYFRDKHIIESRLLKNPDNSLDKKFYEKRKAQACIVDFRHIPPLHLG